MHRSRDMRYERTLHARRLTLANRNPATIAVAAGFLVNWQSQHGASCCALENARSHDGMRFVAVLRVQIRGRVSALICRCSATHRCHQQKTSKERGIAGNRAIWSFVDPTRRARVITLPAKHHIRVPDVGGLKSTRLGSPPKSRIRTGLPRLQICGARRMAHG
jgi:hypothetical protein